MYRYDPRLTAQGKNPLQLDSKEPKISFEEYAYGENRYKVLVKEKPEHAAELMKLAESDVKRMQKFYRNMAKNDEA
jgi:pyruvate-ferredoxin/flavodoxin oxidoreductase